MMMATQMRKSFLRIVSAHLLSGVSFALAAGVTPQRQPDAPNIVIILADDMGWGDTGYNGHPILKTPALDRMAAEGIRLDRFYAASPLCSPTRASILTGQNGQRVGIAHWGKGSLNPEDILLSEILKEEGYRTGCFGKWHVGLVDESGEQDVVSGHRRLPRDFSPPWVNGFDVCFTTENVTPTWDPMKIPDRGNWEDGDRYARGVYGNNYWNERGEMIPHDERLEGDDSKIIMDQVLRFVEKASGDGVPFFAYIPFHAPHTPTNNQGPSLALYGDHVGRHHMAAITDMDTQIGRLRDRLRALGQDDNTLIWFMSDNGAANVWGDGHMRRRAKDPEKAYSGYGSNLPFRGKKLQMYEGGIRVPCVLVFPGMFKEPAVYDMPMVTSDILPTIATMIGKPDVPRNQPQDGICLMEALHGKQTVREKPIGFGYGASFAWVNQRYKYVTSSRHYKHELYDLLADPAETTDIAEQHPAIVERMREELIAWQISCNVSAKGRSGAGTFMKPRMEPVSK